MFSLVAARHAVAVSRVSARHASEASAVDAGRVLDKTALFAHVERVVPAAQAQSAYQAIWQAAAKKAQASKSLTAAQKQEWTTEINALISAGAPAEFVTSFQRVKGLTELLSAEGAVAKKSPLPPRRPPNTFDENAFDDKYAALLNHLNTENTLDLLKRDNDIATLRLKAAALLHADPTLADQWRANKNAPAAKALNAVLQELALKRANKAKVLDSVYARVAEASGVSVSELQANFDREIMVQLPMLQPAPATDPEVLQFHAEIDHVFAAAQPAPAADELTGLAPIPVPKTTGAVEAQVSATPPDSAVFTNLLNKVQKQA